MLIFQFITFAIIIYFVYRHFFDDKEELYIVQSVDLDCITTVEGTLLPKQQQIIHSKSAGVLKYFFEYDSTQQVHVKKGDVLFELMNDKLMLAKDEERVALETLDKTIDQAPDNIINIAYQHVEETRTIYNALKKQQRVIAPFSGYIRQQFTQQGDIVQSDQAILEIVGHHPLQAIADIPKYLADQLHEGQTLNISISEIPLTFKSKISHIIQNKTNNKLYQIMTQIDHQLEDFSYTKINMQIPDTASVPLVPKSALLLSKQKVGVYIVKNNQKEFREIKPGENIDDDLLFVLSGLSAGEEVIRYPKIKK